MTNPEIREKASSWMFLSKVAIGVVMDKRLISLGPSEWNRLYRRGTQPPTNTKWGKNSLRSSSAFVSRARSCADLGNAIALVFQNFI